MTRHIPIRIGLVPILVRSYELNDWPQLRVNLRNAAGIAFLAVHQQMEKGARRVRSAGSGVRN